jgi:hypothetical protein
MNRNNITLDRVKDKSKISFFENIFYWLWHYSKKIYPKTRGSFPHYGASLNVSLLKLLNIYSILFPASIFFNMIEIYALKISETDILKIILCIYPVLFIADDKLYLQKRHIIKEKYNGLSEDKKENYRKIFIVYLIVTITISMILFLSVRTAI